MSKKASSARRSRLGAGLILLAVLAAVMAIMPAALAHHPEITAQATCTEGTVLVSGTSRAWSDCEGDGQCGHPDIRIQFDNFGGPVIWYDVATGSYTDGNGYQFNWGPIAWPAGVFGVSVRAYAVGDWNNGADGGPSSSVFVGYPTPCYGSIVVDKVTYPSTESNFEFDPSWGPDFELDDTDTPKNSGPLFAGTYSVVEEDLPAGWAMLGATCSDGSAVNAISLQAGETVTCTFYNTNKGRIIIDKVTAPATGDDPDFSFTRSWVGGVLSLDDNDPAYDSGWTVTPGALTVVESAMEGWDLTGLICSDPTQNSSVNLDTGTASINVAAGETVSCTFTNTAGGRIIVDKVAAQSAVQLFEFDPSWDDNFFLADPTPPYQSDYLAPGVYSVSEIVPAGWILGGVTCSDESPADAISLQAGETVTCTFTNRMPDTPQPDPGVIVVDKVTQPAGSAQAFEFDPSWGANFLLTDQGAAIASGPLAPGVYSVAEVNLPAGWSLVGAVCDDGSSPAAIGLSSGETVTCTFSNTEEELPGSLTIIKDAEPADDTVFSFGGDLGAFDLMDPSDSSATFPNLAAGQYVVTEGALSGDWLFDGVTCTAQAWSVAGQSVTVNLAPGEQATCTFSNVEEAVLGPNASLTIVKMTNPAGGEGFSFTTSENLSGPFTLDDGGSMLFSELEPGAYMVSEEDPGADWAFQSVTCDALDWSADGGSVTVNLAEGEAALCTFFNIAELPFTGGSPWLLPALFAGLGALLLGAGMVLVPALRRKG